MSINMHTVKQLHDLYEERRDLQRARENLSQNFWLGVINDAFRGVGIRASLVEACGGPGPFADTLHHAAVARIETLQQNIDKLITDLGGEP